MSVFDQRGQKVNYQFNSAGDINFGRVQNKLDLITELEKLKAELTKATDAKVIDQDVANDIEYQVIGAIQQAKKSDPNKEGILDHLNAAKELIKGITAAGGIAVTLAQAAQVVQRLI